MFYDESVSPSLCILTKIPVQNYPAVSHLLGSGLCDGAVAGMALGRGGLHTDRQMILCKKQEKLMRVAKKRKGIVYHADQTYAVDNFISLSLAKTGRTGIYLCCSTVLCSIW